MEQNGIQVCELNRLGIRVFYSAGAAVTQIWDSLGQKHGLPIHTGGCFPTLNHFAFTEHAMEMKTLFTQLMLPQGFLANTQFYPTLAHNDQISEKYAAAVDTVFDQMADILRRGDLEKAFSGVCGSDFGRLVK